MDQRNRSGCGYVGGVLPVHISTTGFSVFKVHRTPDGNYRKTLALSNYNQVTAVEDETTNLQLFDYVLIKGLDREWIGQITAPNINISTVGGPFDPAILHAIRVKQQGGANVQLAETIESWQITLLGEYDCGRLRTLRRRPKPGADVKRLDRNTTIQVLNLPVYRSEENNVFGYLLNAEDVPLCVSQSIYAHHILVSGGTGSGKSNTGANLVHLAAKLGNTVFLYDAKPDYRKISRPNSDKAVIHIWSEFNKYNVKPQSCTNLSRIAIYGVGRAGTKREYTGYNAVIGFRASDFEPYMFAALFFDERANVNQYEEFAAVCSDLKYGDGNNIKGRDFSLDEVINEVEQRKTNYIRQKTQLQRGQSDTNLKVIHDSTADAIIRKIKRVKPNMPWLDAIGNEISTREENIKTDNPMARMRASTMQVLSFEVSQFIAPGNIIHIDCSNLDARTYALFLSRFLYLNQKYLTTNRETGVVEFVDEAHRLFSNQSRYSDVLAANFNRVMVEGRSLKHSVVLSLQNASQVPPLVLNNLNSHIVMRQNNKEVAKAATQTMGSDYAELSLTLATGEALCRMFESSATVLARMAPSPYELERSDATS